MPSLRRFEARDLAGTARLFERVYPEERSLSLAERAAYFEQIFFANPWVQEDLPSWVACDGERIVGFIGVVPRPMLFRGREVRAAVLTQLMVERERRYALAGAQLLRRALAGPQDLTLSDGANESARKVFEACRGSTSTFYSLQWRRLLRPAQSALGQLAGAARPTAQLLAGPVLALADAYVARRTRLHRASALGEETLTAATLLEAMQAIAASFALRPHYELQPLEWLLAEAQAKRRHGALQARLLREANGRVAGWFLYYLNGATSRVLQLAARPGAEDAVLAHLFSHAWRRGAAAIEGRMDARFALALGRQRCAFLAPSVYAVCHARDPEVLGALERGDAFFSRLEGEGWMRFFGERPAAANGPATRLATGWIRPRPQPAVP